MFLKSCKGLKENYIPKNGLYIGLHKITCNFFWPVSQVSKKNKILVLMIDFSQSPQVRAKTFQYLSLHKKNFSL